MTEEDARQEGCENGKGRDRNWEGGGKGRDR